jgi:hypothetical protein
VSGVQNKILCPRMDVSKLTIAVKSNGFSKLVLTANIMPECRIIVAV